MTLMTLQVQKVAVSRCSYTQKANENVAMQKKSLAIAGSPIPQKLPGGEESSDASATRRRPEGRATHLAHLEERREEPTEVAT